MSQQHATEMNLHGSMEQLDGWSQQCSKHLTRPAPADSASFSVAGPLLWALLQKVKQEEIKHKVMLQKINPTSLTSYFNNFTGIRFLFLLSSQMWHPRMTTVYYLSPRGSESPCGSHLAETEMSEELCSYPEEPESNLFPWSF